MTSKQQEAQEARTALLGIVEPGDTVFTILRHVSRSGMGRVISCYVIRDGEPRWLDHYISRAVGYTMDRQREGLKVQGCGMDMGFEVVYNLGRTLWPEGFAVEGSGRNGDTSGWDKDGGYALKQRWL